MDRTKALVALIDALKGEGYGFTPPTPATHGIVVARRRAGRDLRDALGWSLPFRPEALPPRVLSTLEAADAVEDAKGGRLRSRLRAARLGNDIFLHSAYPTEEEDAVFFGPDSYRFARFIAERAGKAMSLVDIGAGSGVGAVVAAKLTGAGRVVLTEVNPKAIALARANLAAAGVEAEIVETAGLDGLREDFDLILANPPFIADPKGRAYRDGGEMHGAEISLDWARQAMGRLAPGGRLLLYTGVAIVGGREPLCEALHREAGEGVSVFCEEIDPDIFGEELRKPAYRGVERIAAMGIIVGRTKLTQAGAGKARSR